MFARTEKIPDFFSLLLDAQISLQCLFSVRTNHIVSLSCALFGSNRTTVHGLQQFGDYTDPRNLTVKGENGKPRRAFHILSVGGREAGPPDLSLVVMCVKGERGWTTDGQPGPVYLGRSYGITSQRQIDILLTKQTTTHPTYFFLPHPPMCVSHRVRTLGRMFGFVFFCFFLLTQVFKKTFLHQGEGP